ncbi:GntR family transcriptional regulator [Roseibium aggregatum]|uniref:GntR family transcriptional regulator n=1 Tax=Roseibium aggregatum TaxID=187304 RepID=A0A926P2W1_9HYPH|nr:GntR family transcriptional regulator [Roseibium aggregatum]MBD1545582.1 GntR family transcriptional regulator [Roseibium aggregatum]
MSLNTVIPIPRRTLHDELVDRLRHMIIEGELAPGEKLSEKDICALFDVSRTPLREAMKVLAKEGLIQLIPNRGATVSKLTMSDLEEAFPIMGALEAVSGELACANITDQEISRMERLHKDMVDCFKARDMSGYFQRNEQIHKLILDAAQNPTLVEMQRSLSGRVRRARYMANMSDERWAQAVAEHEEILKATKERNGPLLGSLLKAHLANKLASVRASLAE